MEIRARDVVAGQTLVIQGWPWKVLRTEKARLSGDTEHHILLTMEAATGIYARSFREDDLVEIRRPVDR